MKRATADKAPARFNTRQLDSTVSTSDLLGKQLSDDRAGDTIASAPRIVSARPHGCVTAAQPIADSRDSREGCLTILGAESRPSRGGRMHRDSSVDALPR
jgi:hypothetical protein